MICDPSTRRFGAMIWRRETENGCQKTIPRTSNTLRSFSTYVPAPFLTF